MQYTVTLIDSFLHCAYSIAFSDLHNQKILSFLKTLHIYDFIHSNSCVAVYLKELANGEKIVCTFSVLTEHVKQ